MAVRAELGNPEPAALQALELMLGETRGTAGLPAGFLTRNHV